MYQYKAKILSVYDGDGVFDAEVDMGMNLTQRKDIRLYGVDTPEIRGEQHDAAIVVRDFVRKLILNKTVTIHTIKDKTGKYGRLLANVIVDGVDLSSLLIHNNYAKTYMGGKKIEWTQDELERIINDNV